LRKLDEGQYAAIILAAAGLKRLDLGDRIRGIITSEDSLPAVGQGALGIECRADRADVIALLQPLHDADTAACVMAERAMSRSLGGSCQVPLGGYAEVQGGKLRMRGFVASPDGQRMMRSEAIGEIAHPETLGNKIADELRAQGADVILAELAL
jgi:hydroxymethylbilane synthase